MPINGCWQKTRIGAIVSSWLWKRKNFRECMIVLNVIVVLNTKIFKSWLHQSFSGELKYTKVGDNLYEVDVDEDRPIADFPVYVNVRNERRFFRRTPIKDAQSEENRTRVIHFITRLRQEKALHLYHLIREYKLFEWWC